MGLKHFPCFSFLTQATGARAEQVDGELVKSELVRCQISNESFHLTCPRQL